MPHFFQHFQIVLLDTHQNETKQCQRCNRNNTSPGSWSTSVPLLLGVFSRTCLVNISWELVKWLRLCSSIEEQRNQILALLVIDTPLPHHYFWIIAGISLLLPWPCWFFLWFTWKISCRPLRHPCASSLLRLLLNTTLALAKQQIS